MRTTPCPQSRPITMAAAASNVFIDSKAIQQLFSPPQGIAPVVAGLISSVHELNCAPLGSFEHLLASTSRNILAFMLWQHYQMHGSSMIASECSKAGLKATSHSQYEDGEGTPEDLLDGLSWSYMGINQSLRLLLLLHHGSPGVAMFDKWVRNGGAVIRHMQKWRELPARHGIIQEILQTFLQEPSMDIATDPSTFSLLDQAEKACQTALTECQKVSELFRVYYDSVLVDIAMLRVAIANCSSHTRPWLQASSVDIARAAAAAVQQMQLPIDLDGFPAALPTPSNPPTVHKSISSPTKANKDTAKQAAAPSMKHLLPPVPPSFKAFKERGNSLAASKEFLNSAGASSQGNTLGAREQHILEGLSTTAKEKQQRMYTYRSARSLPPEPQDDAQEQGGVQQEQQEPQHDEMDALDDYPVVEIHLNGWQADQGKPLKHSIPVEQLQHEQRHEDKPAALQKQIQQQQQQQQPTLKHGSSGLADAHTQTAGNGKHLKQKADTDVNLLDPELAKTVDNSDDNNNKHGRTANGRLDNAKDNSSAEAPTTKPSPVSGEKRPASQTGLPPAKRATNHLDKADAIITQERMKLAAEQCRQNGRLQFLLFIPSAEHNTANDDSQLPNEATVTQLEMAGAANAVETVIAFMVDYQHTTHCATANKMPDVVYFKALHDLNNTMPHFVAWMKRHDPRQSTFHQLVVVAYNKLIMASHKLIGREKVALQSSQVYAVADAILSLRQELKDWCDNKTATDATFKECSSLATSFLHRIKTSQLGIKSCITVDIPKVAATMEKTRDGLCSREDFLEMLLCAMWSAIRTANNNTWAVEFVATLLLAKIVHKLKISVAENTAFMQRACALAHEELPKWSMDWASDVLCNEKP